MSFDPGYSLMTVIFAFLVGLAVGRLTAAWSPARPRSQAPANSGNAPLGPAEAAQQLPFEARAEIERLIAEDRKIEAIRVARAALGLGLKEAKDLVEFVERNPHSGGARAL